MVRIGTIAAGASIATPQPYKWFNPTTPSTFGYFGSKSRSIILTT